MGIKYAYTKQSYGFDNIPWCVAKPIAVVEINCHCNQ